MRRSWLALGLTGCLVLPAHGQGWVVDPKHVITQGQIMSSGAYSPYELIRQVHPLWLSNRGTVFGIITTFGREPGLPVYVDGVFRGGVAELKVVPLAEVEEIRFYPTAEAVIRFSPNAPFGAVEVVTHKGPATTQSDAREARRPPIRKLPPAQLVCGVESCELWGAGGPGSSVGRATDF